MHLDGIERSSYFKNKRSDNKNKQSNKALSRLLVFLGIIALFFLICFFIFKEGIISKDRSVQIQIDLLEKVVVGKETTFLVSVFNQEQSALLDAELFINFPTGFNLVSAEPLCSKISSAGCFINFPEIENNTVKDIKITGKFFNSIGEQAELNTRLSFQLGNFSSWFKREFSQKIVFANPSIDLEIEGPSELMIAEESDFRVKIFSDEDEPLSLAVVLYLPEVFNFINLSPSYHDKKNERTIWQFDFDRYEEKVIDFSGYFKEEIIQSEVVVQVGVFDEDNIFFPQLEKKYLIKISKPGLALGLKANHLFDENIIDNFGNHVLLNLSYKNTSQEKIFEPVFKIGITPVDFVEIEKNTAWTWLVGDNNIAVESSKTEIMDDYQIISFFSSQVNEINPGQEGEIKIDFKIKNKENLSAEQLINSIIVLNAEASAKIFRRQAIIFKTQSNEIKINLQ